MAGLWLGLALGTAVTILVALRPLLGRAVPAWTAVLGPMVLLVAVRRSFAGLAPTEAASDIAARIELVAPVGYVYVGLGIACALVGALGELRERGAPAQVQAGALMVAAGLVWTPWARGEAALWRAAGADPEAVEAARHAAGDALLASAGQAALVLALVLVPGVVWGLVRDRWAGVGEGVAAAVVVALTLNTGQPAREAVEQTYAHHEAPCAADLPVGEQAFDRHPIVRSSSCRVGPDGGASAGP